MYDRPNLPALDALAPPGDTRDRPYDHEVNRNRAAQRRRDDVVEYLGPHGADLARAARVLARIITQTGADRGQLWYASREEVATMYMALGDHDGPMIRYGIGLGSWFIELGPSVRMRPRDFLLRQIAGFLFFARGGPMVALSARETAGDGFSGPTGPTAVVSLVEWSEKRGRLSSGDEGGDS